MCEVLAKGTIKFRISFIVECQNNGLKSLFTFSSIFCLFVLFCFVFSEDSLQNLIFKAFGLVSGD